MLNARFNEIRKSIWWTAVTVFTSGLLGAGLAHVSSQGTSPIAPTSVTTDVSNVDRHQRTYEVLENNEVASSGAPRGETIYFYKCWMCHNNGGRNGDKSGLVGPSLVNVAVRMKTDAALAAKIANGGARMPGFQHTFSAADMSDLITYLKSPTCC